MPKLVRFLTAAVFLLACSALAAAPSSALTITLDKEFDAGTVGNHATVTITENAGALDFVVDLAGTDLGPDSDLHEFYFNLVGSPTGVDIGNTNAPTSAYTLASPATVAGGAGSNFEYEVNFGDGAGGPGNGVLKLASFTISADQPLSLASLLQTSSTSQSIIVNFALHVQGTAFVPGMPNIDSETVGGVIPEPSTALLVGAGLLGLARAGRRTPRRAAC